MTALLRPSRYQVLAARPFRGGYVGRHSGIPPRWEDRLVGQWTGHSAVQSLALGDGGRIIAGGFAANNLEPQGRVVCYAAETGARLWDWRCSLGAEQGAADQITLERDGVAVRVRLKAA
jgi:hypothetical protein